MPSEPLQPSQPPQSLLRIEGAGAIRLPIALNHGGAPARTSGSASAILNRRARPGIRFCSTTQALTATATAIRPYCNASGTVSAIAHPAPSATAI